MNDDEILARRNLARNRRFKKPICSSLNWMTIGETISEILEACTDVQYMAPDDEILIEVFGDEAAFEYKLVFSDLYADCERLSDYLEEYRSMYIDGVHSWGELFELFFPAIETNDSYMGYDTYESDYFPMEGYEIEAAQSEAKKKLLRLTKEQLIDLAHMSLETVRQFVSVKYRYDCLKDALDILRGQNTGLVNLIKSIEEAYEEASEKTMDFKYDFGTRLDRIIMSLPDELWLT